MNSVKTFFLKAAHWQLFILMAAMYFANWLVGVSVIGIEPVPVKNIPALTMLFIQATGMITLGIFFAWLWAMGSFLNSLVKPMLRLNFGLFRFALIFPLVYGLAFPFVAWAPKVFNFYIILPIHLFVMFCVLYAFRFVAKSLALQEEVRFLTFRDYYRAFFLLWFFPIGVWWIQPKINRLYLAQVNQPT